MKTNLFLKITLIGCLLICFGCSKDSTEEDNEINYGTVQLKINGSATVLKPITPVLEFYNDGTYSIGGINCDDSKQIILHFPSTMGTYSCGKLEDSYASLWIGDFFPCTDLFGDGPGAVIYHAIEGSVTISEISEQRVRGTYHFIAESHGGGEIISVSDGVFNVLRE
ncbi:DUF6252 family protein [Aestuariivivens sediminis]|uniref:DUF6252 family protein n=1 Tax=Aestuariivivens sediminis TaxID=2913557 RepID=UPI001F59A541|nr:DUF6252 family protein [Aestuariivivens sediminis]